MATKNTKQQKLLTTFVALCVVAILVVGVQVTKKDATSSPTTSTTAVADPVASNVSYKDGTYSATGKYSSPGGGQTLDVTVTLAGNTITEAKVTPSAKDGVAQVYQSYFVDNFKALVVGKDASTLKLSRVAGSSLTSKGFNDALIQIRKDAQS